MTHTLQYQSHKLRYYVEGEGETLLFLHGWPNNSRLWQAQVAHLRDRFRVITFDWLGFGQSDKPREHPYQFDEMSQILDQLIEEI
ncbi:MAG: alpha/beta fold hydrolase, partial [Bacteroidota bacterium]